MLELLQAKVTPAMKGALRAIQDAKGITMSEQVRRALQAWIDDNTPGQPEPPRHIGFNRGNGS